MAKVKVEIEVEVEGPNADGEFTFVNLKVGDGQTIPLPPDAPAPRRLAKDLAREAGANLNPKTPKVERVVTADKGSKGA